MPAASDLSWSRTGYEAGLLHGPVPSALCRPGQASMGTPVLTSVHEGGAYMQIDKQRQPHAARPRDGCLHCFTCLRSRNIGPRTKFPVRQT